MNLKQVKQVVIIMAEVVALALTENTTLSEEVFLNFFKTRGFELTDENNGLFQSDSGDSFKGVFYTEARYILLESNESSEDGLLPDEIFDFVLSISDNNALISVGDDEGYGVEIHTEMNLGKFQKDFRKAQESEE